MAIFRENVKRHPKSWNAHDSLGEGLAALGKKGRSGRDVQEGARDGSRGAEGPHPGNPRRDAEEALTAGSPATPCRPIDWGRMDDEFLISCPYCGEEVEVHLEPDLEGSLVQDCEVCCNPWLLRISGAAGERRVDVARADGSD